MRHPVELLNHGLAVIDRGFTESGAFRMCPLFSGGHDSLAACFVASQHPKFSSNVYHIDTGIGSKRTRQFVEEVCREEGWALNVLKSKATYEMFIRKLGFPGPGAHQWVYSWLKDRCISKLSRRPRVRLDLKTMLITGCRSEESVRRMGHVVPIKIGETSKKTKKTTKLNRVWVSPCHDWRRVTI